MLLTAAQPIWSLPLPEAYAGLQSRPEGLSSHEAEERLERFGANRLPPPKRRSLLLRFTDQLVHFMALLLWVAGGLAFIARAPQLGWAIWAVILINGVFSFWQEFKAERTLQALAGNLPPMVRVWRDGRLQELPADQLVCGDRVVLEEGDQIPADCRVVVAHQSSSTSQCSPANRCRSADLQLHLHHIHGATTFGIELKGGTDRGLVSMEQMGHADVHHFHQGVAIGRHGQKCSAPQELDGVTLRPGAGGRMGGVEGGRPEVQHPPGSGMRAG